MQAGLDFSVRRDADAVAFRAEVGADRTDQADVPLRSRQPIQFGDAAVRFHDFQPGKPLCRDGAGKKGLGAEVSAVVHGHQLDKTHVQRVAARELGEHGNLIIVKSADQDGVELDPIIAAVQRGFEPCQRVAQIADARDVAEFFRIQRIQTDVQAADACFPERFCQLRKQGAVGGHADFPDAVDGSGLRAEVYDVRLDQWFAARDAQFADSERGGGTDGADGLFLGQHLLMPFLADAVLGHAVAAAQIAALSHGKTQIRDLSSVGIGHFGFPLSLQIRPSSRNRSRTRAIRPVRPKGVTR